MNRTVSAPDQAIIALFLIETFLFAIIFALTGSIGSLLCFLACPWMAYRQWVYPFREILTCSFILQLD